MCRSGAPEVEKENKEEAMCHWTWGEGTLKNLERAHDVGYRELEPAASYRPVPKNRRYASTSLSATRLLGDLKMYVPSPIYVGDGSSE